MAGHRITGPIAEGRAPNLWRAEYGKEVALSSGACRLRGVVACMTALGLVLAASEALAAKPPQAKRPAHVKPAPPTPPDDGLGPRDVYLEADILVDDDVAKLVSAEGHAEARYQGRIIRADKILYNTVTGAAHAHGHIVIINVDQTSEYADDMDLDADLTAGVALAFAAREANNVTVTAGAAIRRNENVVELNHALYTPCATCKANGQTKAPTFSIQASRILQDHERQVVYYRDAVIRVFGVPVFYSPIFWHPDPAAVRRSGFLTPTFSITNKRGFSYEQPYLWVLSPSADLTISPQFNTSVNPLLNLHFRERFYSGKLDIRAGITDEQNFDNNIKFDNPSARSYILAKGEFDLDRNWNWGFGAERASDPAFFRRYNLHDIYADRGPFGADTARLVSQLYTIREDEHSYLSAAAISYQSLRSIGANPITVNGKTYYETQFESAKTFPTVAPLLEGHFDRYLFGGRLSLTGTAVALSRDNPVVAVVDPSGLQPAGPERVGAALSSATSLRGLRYTNSNRASLNLDWRTTVILPVGLRIDPFVQGRADYYAISDAQSVQVAPDGTETLLGRAKANSSRSFGTVGADISYPLIRPLSNGGSLTLEPLAQIALSPRAKLNPNIPNEDSTALEFDDTNLFSTNRHPGYDVYEGGSRLNLAGRISADLANGARYSFLAGRAFRSEADPQFTPLSGLSGTSSDWVTYATAQPNSLVTVFNRARFDGSSFAVRREEAGLNVNYGRFFGSVRYNYNTNGLTLKAVAPTAASGGLTTYKSVIGTTEDAQVLGSIFITKKWGISVNASRDIRDRVFPVAEVGLIYQDDCIRLDLLYHHDETYRGYGAKVGASDGIGFRLTLTTLGDTPAAGGRRNDAR